MPGSLLPDESMAVPRTGEPGVPVASKAAGPPIGQPGGMRSKRITPEWRRVLDRTEKQEFVASLAAVFANTSMVVVTRPTGLTVAEATDLRKRMRAAGATFKVAKNRLATLALDGTQFEGLKSLMKGPTALAWSHDPVAVSKAAVEFAKINDKFVVLGGSLGTQLLDAAGVKALSELPSLDQLRANLVGMLQTPATRIAGVLAAPAGQIARVLAAYSKQDEAIAEAA